MRNTTVPSCGLLKTTAQSLDRNSRPTKLPVPTRRTGRLGALPARAVPGRVFNCCRKIAQPSRNNNKICQSLHSGIRTWALKIEAGRSGVKGQYLGHGSGVRATGSRSMCARSDPDERIAIIVPPKARRSIRAPTVPQSTDFCVRSLRASPRAAGAGTLVCHSPVSPWPLRLATGPSGMSMPPGCARGAAGRFASSAVRHAQAPTCLVCFHPRR